MFQYSISPAASPFLSTLVEPGILPSPNYIGNESKSNACLILSDGHLAYPLFSFFGEEDLTVLLGGKRNLHRAKRAYCM